MQAIAIVFMALIPLAVVAMVFGWYWRYHVLPGRAAILDDLQGVIQGARHGGEIQGRYHNMPVRIAPAGEGQSAPGIVVRAACRVEPPIYGAAGWLGPLLGGVARHGTEGWKRLRIKQFRRRFRCHLMVPDADARARLEENPELLARLAALLDFFDEIRLGPDGAELVKHQITRPELPPERLERLLEHVVEVGRLAKG